MKYALIKDYYAPSPKEEPTKTTHDYASEGIATQIVYNAFNEKMRERPMLVQHILGMMAAGQEIDSTDSDQRAIVTATNAVLEKTKTQALGFGLETPTKGGRRAGIESTTDAMWNAWELQANRQELSLYEKGTPEYMVKKQEHAILALRVLVGMNIEADFVPAPAIEEDSPHVLAIDPIGQDLEDLDLYSTQQLQTAA